MNPICRFIDFIEVLTDDEYDHILECIPSKYYFKNGGCYEFVKTLKHFLPNGEVYVSNDFNHCAFFYKGILYDIDGIIEDINSFHAATPDDFEYLNDEYFFGRIEIKFDGVAPSAALVQDILQCRIDRLIEECKELDDNPNYYTNKQKQFENPKK